MIQKGKTTMYDKIYLELNRVFEQLGKTDVCDEKYYSLLQIADMLIKLLYSSQQIEGK